MLEQALSLSSATFARLLMFVWSLWKNRNAKLWDDVSQPSPVIISSTMAWYESFLQANSVGKVKQSSSGSKRWSPPTDCVLINVDGSYISTFNIGGVGGVIRDSSGAFLAGFSYRKSFVTSAQHIELQAIHAGLQFLQAMNISSAFLHSDCLLAVQAIHGTFVDLISCLGALRK